MYATTAKNEPCSTDRRALLINGSPRADGPTARLLAALESSLPATVAVQRFDCFAQPVLPCNDCRACHIIDGCARPDLKEFYRALEDAALLVFASPVYNLSFPAPLKAVVDRTQRYWAARFVRNIRPPIVRPKRVVLLTAAGADDPEGGGDAGAAAPPGADHSEWDACFLRTLRRRGYRTGYHPVPPKGRGGRPDSDRDGIAAG